MSERVSLSRLASRRISRLNRRHRVTILILGAVGAALLVALFALRANVVHHAGLAASDKSNLQFVTTHRSNVLVVSADHVTQLGNVSSLIPLALAAGLALWVARRRVVVAAAPLVALLVAGGIIWVAKEWVRRARPAPKFEVVREGSYSFPSGHAGDSTALFITLALVVALFVLRRPVMRVLVVAAASILVVLIGLSRLELGVHWPTDVLAGWFVGLLVTIVVVGRRSWSWK